MVDEEDGDGAKSQKPQKPGTMKYIVAGGVAIFVAVLGAQVAAPVLTGMLAGSHAAATPQGEGDEGEAVDEGQDDQVDVANLEPAKYVALDPPFVVSFVDDDGASRFLQLSLQAMARSEKTIEDIKQHSPAIRNAFLFVISGHKLEELTTLEGKEALRKEMLAAANDIMAKNTGKADIEDLYFTSLVIQ